MTTFRACRISVPNTDYAVLLSSGGAANLDVSIWLTEQQALELASQLRAAVAQEPAAKEAA